MARWKIPELNGGFDRLENHLFLWSIFQQAMFDETGGWDDGIHVLKGIVLVVRGPGFGIADLFRAFQEFQVTASRKYQMKGPL